MPYSHAKYFSSIYVDDYIALIEVVVLGPICGFICFILWTEDNTCILPLVVILWIQSFLFLINVLHLSPKIAKFLSPFVVLSWALLLLLMAVMFVF